MSYNTYNYYFDKIIIILNKTSNTKIIIYILFYILFLYFIYTIYRKLIVKNLYYLKKKSSKIIIEFNTKIKDYRENSIHL